MSSNQADLALQPIPNSIKYGGIALVLVLIIVFYWVFSSSSKDESIQTHSDVEKPENTLGSKLSNSPINKLSAPVGAITDTAIYEENIPSVKDNKVVIKLTKLEAQIEQLLLENNLRQQGQDSLIQDLQAQITAQALTIEQLQNNKKVRLAKVKTTVTRKKSVKKDRVIKPPFDLVSIDLWGNDFYAVIRYSNELHELTYGQVINGWSLFSIDRQTGAATFMNKVGTRRDLLVKS